MVWNIQKQIQKCFRIFLLLSTEWKYKYKENRNTRINLKKTSLPPSLPHNRWYEIQKNNHKDKLKKKLTFFRNPIPIKQVVLNTKKTITNIKTYKRLSVFNDKVSFESFHTPTSGWLLSLIWNMEAASVCCFLFQFRLLLQINNEISF